MAQRPPWFRLETSTVVYLTWTFSEGPSSRDDVAPGGLTHTDESSTCLSGIVRGSGIASHRPQFKPFYLEHGPSVVDLHGDERSS